MVVNIKINYKYEALGNIKIINGEDVEMVELKHKSKDIYYFEIEPKFPILYIEKENIWDNKNTIFEIFTLSPKELWILCTKYFQTIIVLS